MTGICSSMASPVGEPRSRAGRARIDRETTPCADNVASDGRARSDDESRPRSQIGRSPCGTLQRTAREADTGRSALAAGTGQNAPKATFAQDPRIYPSSG